MGRRSDHSRHELAELILGAAHMLMAEVGFQAFSAREVAKRIGYSVGTIYNVFGSLERLVLAVNSRTFVAWAELIRSRLDAAGADRVAALVEGYFDFAEANPHLWMAIYDHRLSPAAPFPEDYFRQRADLTGLVEAEIATILPPPRVNEAAALARSLVAMVHGHCVFMLNGTFALLGETDARGAALARAREILTAQR
jgi:AcrR family transcriptional regulator